MSPPPLRVELTVEVNDAILAHLSFTNTSGEPFALYTINACAGGRIRNNLFQIRRGEERVPYAGRLAKRPTPQAADFQVLPPGGSASATVRLDEAYTFPPGGGDYVAVYDAHNPSLGAQPLTRLRSNEQPFKVSR